MASPVDAGRATTGITSATDPWTANLPASIAAGNLLIMMARTPNATTITTPSGWTLFSGLPSTADPSDDTTYIWYRWADGAEGTTVSLNLSANAKGAVIAWRITGAENPSTQVPELSTIATATSTTPNPTTVTPTGGSKDYLFLWLGAWDQEPTNPPGTPPANYTNWVGASSGSASTLSTNNRLAGGSRQLTAASEDPGSVTTSSNVNWSAWCMAIHPPVGVAPRTRVRNQAVSRAAYW